MKFLELLIHPNELVFLKSKFACTTIVKACFFLKSANYMKNFGFESTYFCAYWTDKAKIFQVGSFLH
jgi:hypothetical protein